MTQLISFILEHKELLLSALVGLIGLAKLTTWGRAQAAALTAIVHVIESLRADDVKTAVAAKQKSLPPAAQDALTDAVDTADPKKPTPSLSKTVLREIFRGIFRK